MTVAVGRHVRATAPSTVVCSACILDASVPDITFDESGGCNFCRIHDALAREYPLGAEAEGRLNQLTDRIRREGAGKRYDCIIGVSGGTDSSYTLHIAKQLGLRPLAVHFDNGWNSEVAVRNIRHLITKLGIDLSTYVVDWEEFKDLQLSFLKASVSDAEIPTDQGIKAVLYRTAAAEGVNYIIAGGSFRTEGKIPIGWTYMDARYIRSVHRQFGAKRRRSYPTLSMTRFAYYSTVRGIKFVRYFLNYLDYSKEHAKEILAREYGWEDYHGHHFESIYTRFFQSYLLPTKFRIDKRRTQYSALVRSGQLTRAEALRKIEEPPCPPDQMVDDARYVRKKLGLTEAEFDAILARPVKTFRDYPTYYPWVTRLRRPVKLAYRLMGTSMPNLFFELESR